MKYVNAKKVGNKIRLGVYLDPTLMAKFEMYRKTLYGIEISQSIFMKTILEEYFNELEKK